MFFVRFTIGMFFLQLCTISVPLCHLTHGFGMQSGVILGFAPQNIYGIITIIIIITIVTIIIITIIIITIIITSVSGTVSQ